MSYSNDDTDRLVSQVYADEIAEGLGNACGEGAPCEGQGCDEGTSRGHDLGNKEGAQAKTYRDAFMSMMATERRMTSESEQMAMCKELVQPVQ